MSHAWIFVSQSRKSFRTGIAKLPLRCMPAASILMAVRPCSEEFTTNGSQTLSKRLSLLVVHPTHSKHLILRHAALLNPRPQAVSVSRTAKRSKRTRFCSWGCARLGQGAAGGLPPKSGYARAQNFELSTGFFRARVFKIFLSCF